MNVIMASRLITKNSAADPEIGFYVLVRTFMEKKRVSMTGLEPTLLELIFKLGLGLNPGASGCNNFVTKPFQLLFSPTS